MNSLAKKHFEKILKDNKILGLKKNCKYYPCHSKMEDCTWCYCPFYPCQDISLGKYIKTKTGKRIWSCEDCNWIHNKEIAKRVLNEIKKLKIKKPEDIEKNHKKLIQIKEKIRKNKLKTKSRR